MTPVVDIDPTLVIWHDAVKIGLGAIIGGIFGLVVAIVSYCATKRSNENALKIAEMSNTNALKIAGNSNQNSRKLANQAHHLSLAEKRVEERRQLLIQVANYVSELESISAGYFSQLLLWIETPTERRQDEHSGQIIKRVLDERSVEFVGATKGKHQAGGILLLLGEQPAHDAYARYIDAIMGVADQIEADNSILTAEFKDEQERQFGSLNHALFQELAKVHKRTD